MTEREKFDIGTMKEIVFARDGWKCRHCNQSVHTYHSPQMAHGISQSKKNIAKYGAQIVHSVYNLYSACSLFCNDALSVGMSNEATEAERIRNLVEGEQ